jgi:hypothetical protein
LTTFRVRLFRYCPALLIGGASIIDAASTSFNDSQGKLSRFRES